MFAGAHAPRPSRPEPRLRILERDRSYRLILVCGYTQPRYYFFEIGRGAHGDATTPLA